MRSWIIATLFVILHSSSHQVTGHGDEPHAEAFQGDPYTTDGCDTSRGCFDCRESAGEACPVNVAWEPDADEGVIKFTLYGDVGGDNTYVAMGITESANMFAADVYVCISASGTLNLQRYWNPPSGRATNLNVKKGVSNEEISFENNQIRCQFTRNMSLDDNDTQFFDVSGNSSYFIITALGPYTGDAPGYHTGRGVSASVILSQAISVGGGGGDGASLMKAHGCLMIIAWLGLASIGITMARYFKPMWPTSKLCGEKVWFAIHRSCMVTALLLFVIAFIIIFVHVGGFIENLDSQDGTRRFAHAILGTIATVLGIINPIMAIFRPHPGTSNRPIFNWLHWGVGTLGLMCAQTTIALALVPAPFDGGNTILPGLQSYTFWVVIGYLVFHTVMWILLYVLRCTSDSAGRSDDIPLSGKNDPIQAPDDTASPSLASAVRQFCNDRHIYVFEKEGSIMKTMLLFIYCLGIIFVCAFLVITIAIA